MPFARQRFALPALPAHPQRYVVDQALNEAYCRIRFTSQEAHTTLVTFFVDVEEVMKQTVDLLLHEQYELKVVTTHSLLMLHKVDQEEKEEMIHLALKATPL